MDNLLKNGGLLRKLSRVSSIGIQQQSDVIVNTKELIFPKPVEQSVTNKPNIVLEEIEESDEEDRLNISVDTSAYHHDSLFDGVFQDKEIINLEEPDKKEIISLVDDDEEPVSKKQDLFSAFAFDVGDPMKQMELEAILLDSLQGRENLIDSITDELITQCQVPYSNLIVDF